MREVTVEASSSELGNTRREFIWKWKNFSGTEIYIVGA